MKPIPIAELQKYRSEFHTSYFTGFVTLWTDSTEYRVKGKRKMSKYDDYYSYKVSGPGRKFLTILDGKTRSIFVFGPYAPRLPDSTILSMHRKKLEKLYPNQVIIGDGHFTVAARSLKQIKVLCPFILSGRPKIRFGEKVFKSLSPDQKKFNNTIAQVRGRVESPFLD